MPTTLTPVADGPEPTIRDVLLAVHGLGTKVDGLDAKVDGLDVRMDRFETRMDRFEGRMDRIEERMNHLDVRMDRLTTSVDGVSTRVTGVEAEVGKMDKRITDLMIFEGTNLKWLTERDAEVRQYLATRHDEVHRHLTDTEIHLPRQRSADLLPEVGLRSV